MSRTVSDVVTEARGHLQDSDAAAGYRYSDDDLVRYLNTALLATRRLRPDLFIASYAAATPVYTSADIGLNTAIVIDEMAYEPIVFYVVGSAELGDDEFTVDSRATQLMQAFSNKLTRPV